MFLLLVLLSVCNSESASSIDVSPNLQSILTDGEQNKIQKILLFPFKLVNKIIKTSVNFTIQALERISTTVASIVYMMHRFCFTTLINIFVRLPIKLVVGCINTIINVVLFLLKPIILLLHNIKFIPYFCRNMFLHPIEFPLKLGKRLLCLFKCRIEGIPFKPWISIYSPDYQKFEIPAIKVSNEFIKFVTAPFKLLYVTFRYILCLIKNIPMFIWQLFRKILCTFKKSLNWLRFAFKWLLCLIKRFSNFIFNFMYRALNIDLFRCINSVKGFFRWLLCLFKRFVLTIGHMFNVDLLSKVRSVKGLFRWILCVIKSIILFILKPVALILREILILFGIHIRADPEEVFVVPYHGIQILAHHVRAIVTSTFNFIIGTIKLVLLYTFGVFNIHLSFSTTTPIPPTEIETPVAKPTPTPIIKPTPSPDPTPEPPMDEVDPWIEVTPPMVDEWARKDAEISEMLAAARENARRVALDNAEAARAVGDAADRLEALARRAKAAPSLDGLSKAETVIESIRAAGVKPRGSLLGDAAKVLNKKRRLRPPSREKDGLFHVGAVRGNATIRFISPSVGAAAVVNIDGGDRPCSVRSVSLAFLRGERVVLATPPSEIPRAGGSIALSVPVDADRAKVIVHSNWGDPDDSCFADAQLYIA